MFLVYLHTFYFHVLKLLRLLRPLFKHVQNSHNLQETMHNNLPLSKSELTIDLSNSHGALKYDVAFSQSLWIQVKYLLSFKKTTPTLWKKICQRSVLSCVKSYQKHFSGLVYFSFPNLSPFDFTIRSGTKIIYQLHSLLLVITPYAQICHYLKFLRRECSIFQFTS